MTPFLAHLRQPTKQISTNSVVSVQTVNVKEVDAFYLKKCSNASSTVNLII